MVITILEATVDEGRWPDLLAAYAGAAGEEEPGMRGSYLVQDGAAPERWRIISVWESGEALAAMRAAGPPKGPLFFRAAGAEPTLSIWNVREALGDARAAREPR